LEDLRVEGVKIFLCLIKHHAVNAYGKIKKTPRIINLSTKLSFKSRPFYLRCPLDKSLGGPQKGADALEKRQIFYLDS
jgi:hypothetical protein